MSLSTVYSACPAIQTGLPEAFGHAPFQENLPFLEFVNSDLNRRAITQLVSPGGAKKKEVIVSFFPRIPESRVETGGAVCGPFDPIGNNTATYEITADPLVSGEVFAPEDLASFCEGNASVLNQKLAMHLDVIDRAAASLIATQAASQAGKWSTDTKGFYNVDGTEHLVVATELTDGEISSFAEVINGAAMLSGYNSSVIAFGGMALNQAYRRAMAGCCSNQGIDVQRIIDLYGYMYAYDKRVASAFGGNSYSVITTPGATQMLSYQLAGWKDGMPGPAIQGSNYVRIGAFTRAGVPVDILFKDECPGELTVSVSANVELITLPANLFDASDSQYGVNYLNKVKVVNA